VVVAAAGEILPSSTIQHLIPTKKDLKQSCPVVLSSNQDKTSSNHGPHLPLFAPLVVEQSGKERRVVGTYRNLIN
jgi:hypothetical protein